MDVRGPGTHDHIGTCGAAGLLRNLASRGCIGFASITLSIPPDHELQSRGGDLSPPRAPPWDGPSSQRKSTPLWYANPGIRGTIVLCDHVLRRRHRTIHVLEITISTFDLGKSLKICTRDTTTPCNWAPHYDDEGLYYSK